MLASPNCGYLIITLSALFFAIASYAVLFSAFLPRAGIPVCQNTSPFLGNVYSSPQLLDVLARDTHYKYFVVFIIPTGAYFVIANWVGWQYYRNS